MKKINVRWETLLILTVVFAVALIIGSVLLMNHREAARIEEQKEAISQVVPGISDTDLDYLMSRNIYAAYGEVRHNQDLQQILRSAGSDLEEKHFYHWDGDDGPIIGHGVDYLDCIEIYLYDEFPVTRTTTDEIYQVIESHARVAGTNGTPVLFIRTGLIELDTNTS